VNKCNLYESKNILLPNVVAYSEQSWMFYTIQLYGWKFFVADFIRLNSHFSQNKQKKSLFEPRIWGLSGNVRIPFIAPWIARGDFLFVIIELFSLLLRCYKRNLSKSAFFEWAGWVSLSANVRQSGASHANHCWDQNTRVIALNFVWYQKIHSDMRHTRA